MTMTIAPADELLSVTDIMASLRLSKGTVQRFCRTGVLPAVKIGNKKFRVRRSDLDAWWQRQREDQEARVLERQGNGG